MSITLFNTLVFVSAAFVLTGAFLFLYTRITPFPEFKLIGDGNTAVACSLSGALIGFALPLCAIIASTHSILDMLLWAVIGFGLQLAIYGIVHLKVGELERKVAEGSTAAGVYLGSCSLVGGLIVAACLIP